MTELRPMWSTTVHPSEYDIDEQMRDFVKAANKANECYYGIDVGKLWGLYKAYKEQSDEITTLRAQLAEANGIIQRLCLSIAYNKTSSNALLESQKAAHEYLDKVTTA